MPLGSKQIPTTSGEPTGLTPASERLGQAGPEVPLPQQLGLGENNHWEHITIEPADFDDGNAYVTRFELEIHALQLLELEGVRLYVAVERHASDESGGYDVLHPGSGEYSKHIEGARWISILRASATTEPIELYGYAGTFAARVQG